MPKKRGQGEGSVYYSGSRQRWIAVLDLGRGPDGVRRRVRMSGKTRAEVRRKLEEEQKAAAAGLTFDDQRTTVAEFCAYWLQHGIPAAAKSPNSISSIEWAVNRHIVPRIGHRRLRELTADDIDKLMRDMATAGYSKYTMVRVHGEIARILRFAERRGKVMRNVATLVDVPAGPKKQGRSLTVAQAKALLDAADGDRLEALYVTGLLMGLRPGELLGLPWTNVDLDEGRLRVSQSLKREHNKLLVGEPKTLRSRRTLDMPDLVIDSLKRHRDRQDEERVEAGATWTETDLVFTTMVGTPIDPSNLRREFDKLTRKAGLGHWHPHELRHSAASLLSAAGVPIEQISDVLGHEGPRTTAAVYRHLVNPSVSAGKAPMDGLFSRIDAPENPPEAQRTPGS
jgi:integrase